MSRRTKVLRDYIDKSYVLMHPVDAQKLGIKKDQRVKVRSRRGELATFLKISDEVLEGELFMPWHFTESQVNRLTRDELDPFSKIAPFKLSAVSVTIE